MNFRPIFRNRFKDDMKGVALFMALLLLCNAFIVSLLLVVSAQVQGQAFSNFSVAMSCFTLAIGAATVREDLRLGIQNGVSRGTSLTACFAANIAAAMVAALGVTLVEWACIYLRGTVRIGFYSMSHSSGATLLQCAEILYNMGCTDAINLDGGNTAAMLFMGENVQLAENGGIDVNDRSIPDILAVGTY